MFKWRVSEKEFISIPFLSWIEIDGYGNLRYRDTHVEVPRNGDTVILAGREFNIPALICIAHKNILVDIETQKYVRAMFVDGDESNWDVDNLSYRFEPAYEIAKYPGYRVIPGLTRYVINEVGDIRDRKDGSICRPCFETNRYVTVCLKHDCRQKAGSKVLHRCLMLAWREYPADVDRMDVNHLDADKWNYSLDNLEWATRSRNVLHAIEYGLRDDNKPVLLWDTWNDTVTEYLSITQASVVAGVTDTTLGKHARKVKLFNNRWVVKFKNDPQPWPDIKSADGNFVGSGIMNQIRIYHPDGSTTVVHSANEASRQTGVKSATVLYRANNNPGWHGPEGYGFEHVNKVLHQQALERRQQLLDSRPDFIVVVDRDGNETPYKTVVDAAKAIGISKPAATSRLNESYGLVDVNGYMLEYAEPERREYWRDVLRKHYRAVEITKPDGTVTVVLGTASAANYSQLPKTKVAWRIKNQAIKCENRRKDKWDFRYLNKLAKG